VENYCALKQYVTWAGVDSTKEGTRLKRENIVKGTGCSVIPASRVEWGKVGGGGAPERDQG